MKCLVFTFLWTAGLYAGAQAPVLPNPLTEKFNGNVQQVTSMSYTASGDSLNPVKDAARNEEKLLHKRTYDKKGNLAEIAYLHSDGSVKYRTVYTRDKKNNIIQEVNLMVNGKKAKTIVRTFNKKGLMLTQLTRNEKDEIIEKRIITYQDTARLTETVSTSDTMCTRKFEFRRDKKGYLIEQVWYDTDCKTIVSKVAIQYDDKKNVTGMKTFTPGGDLISRKTFTYDKDGRLTSKTQYNASKVVLKHNQYVYDDKGRMRQETESGRNSELLTKVLYSYDSTDRVEWDYHFSSTRDVEVYSYYTYDKYGNVIQRRQKRANMPQAQIDSLVFEYDEKGNWIKRTVYRSSRPAQIDERKFVYYP
jgi:uncharacterized protein YkuJ